MDTKEQSASILCVTGSAFLYVMRGRPTGRDGPAPVPEQDPIFKDQK